MDKQKLEFTNEIRRLRASIDANVQIIEDLKTNLKATKKLHRKNRLKRLLASCYCKDVAEVAKIYPIPNGILNSYGLASWEDEEE